MEVESRDAIEEADLVQVLVDGEGRDLRSALDKRRAKSELIHHRDSERLHQRTRVLSEALLARDEGIPMVCVFHLPLLHVVRKAHVVMRTYHETGPFALQPTADGRDLLGRRLLLRNQVVETEHHQRVGILQDAFVYRKLVPRLVNPLKYRDRMAGDLGNYFLKGECRPVE